MVAWEAMRLAAAGCREGRYRGVVTGPVSKARLAAAGYPHPGQTEFFAAEWGGQPVMAFRGDHLRLALATWHLSLREVPSHLTPETIKRAVRAAAALAEADGVTTPRIGVCGLNPHAGEQGLLGTEEEQVINPALRKLQGEIPGVSLALPGDTVFARALQGEFDAVVAMYHDQGLGPLKALDFANAVNVTLGLPFVRTSPDHGTGFDIAGQGTADATSFARAVELARKLTG
jgi:4-hydroxythreonine-4-phosphate dehydrogenase